MLAALGDALEDDPRALGAVAGYEPDRQRLFAVFEIRTISAPTALEIAVGVAWMTFAGALRTAGIPGQPAGFEIVEGRRDKLPQTS